MVSGQRESREEEREERRAEQASSAERHENCSAEGSEERIVEERVAGERVFRLRRVVTV